jgi:hypothetical protein
VAISLVSEVMNYVTGTDLTVAERYILAAIAEQANGKTRQAWQETAPGKRRWVLAERVGLSETGLRSALQRLAKRGLECRVPLGTDAKGRAFYAVHGRQTTYQVPILPGAKGDVQASPSESVNEPDGDVLTSTGDVQASAYGDVSSSTGDVSSSRGDAQASPYPSSPVIHKSNSSTREPRTIVMDATGATPDEADAIVKRIHAERNPKNLSGFLRHLAASGDLGQYLTDVRAAAARYADDNDRKIRQGMPRCEHGVAGGTQAHTVTGLIRCGACRTRNRAGRLNGTARVIPIRTQEVS